MAIFSLTHSWLGKSHKDYKPGVARQHANYITRRSTCTKLIGARAPTERQELKAWLHAQEIGDRKNARVVDKVLVALPIELNRDQREALLHDFCESLTQGRASWIAAVHDKGKDAHNPHAHIMFRDRDIETGRRVMLTTERGSTNRFREAWEGAANRALEQAGFSERVDRRSLADQGLERDAERHKGPQMAVLAERERKRRQKSLEMSVGTERDWTDRAGMTAQQRSAAEWIKQTAAERDRDARLEAFLRRRASAMEMDRQRSVEPEP